MFAKHRELNFAYNHVFYLLSLLDDRGVRGFSAWRLICEPPTNHDILREPSSIIVLSFTYKASFYLSFNISSPFLFLASA